MSKANRRKRLWNQIRRVRTTMPDGTEALILRPPDSWTELHPKLADEEADRMLVQLRTAGWKLWLHPEADGTVRTRMMPDPSLEVPAEDILETLAYFSRALGMAVARSGDWDPPQPNPWNDQPLPKGGHWTWE